MATKLTKQAFEAGKPFVAVNAPEHGVLTYQEHHDHQTLRRYPQRDFFCSIELVNDRGFEFNHSFLNEPINGFICFNECTEYNPKKI